MRPRLYKDYGSSILGTPDSVYYRYSIPWYGDQSLCPPESLCQYRILLILLLPLPKSKRLKLRLLYNLCYSIRLVYIILFFLQTLFEHFSLYN